MSFEADDIVDPIATENPDVVVETPKTADEIEQEPKPIEGEEIEQPKEEPKPKNRAQERIEKLARENAELRQFKLEQESRQNAPPPSERPQLESFDSYDEYQDALEAYQIDKAEKRVLEKLNSEKAQKSQVEAQAEYETAVADLQDDGLDVQALTEKAESLPPLPVQLNQFGLSTKETLRLAAALIQDEDLYFDLSQMNAVQAARRIGQEIDKMTTGSSAPKIPNAPKPIKPTSANAPVKRDQKTMSDDEWYRSETQSRKGK